MTGTPVHKFGGTSVGTPDRILSIVHLMRPALDVGSAMVVVSAFGGVTNELLSCVDAALNRDRSYRDILDGLRTRHREAISVLAPGEVPALEPLLDGIWAEVQELCDGVYLVRECSPRTRDAIGGAGERASAPVVAAAFRAAGFDAVDVDARDLIRTDSTHGEAEVQFNETRSAVTAWADRQPASRQVAVVTGFIASSPDGVTTTLGRSGSDYSATILGWALDAPEVVIWTDVDGVLSADPRLVPDAFRLPELSYREAGEMAYFGAKVLHPRTMRPVEQASIPLFIRNTMNPASEGTAIRAVTSDPKGRVRAVTAVRDMSVLMIEGSGMMGVPGIAARTFQSLAREGVNVLVISQASSEQSICIGIRSERSGVARAALLSEFARELDRRDIASVTVMPACAVVSVVGDGMRMQPGLAGRMFSTLGRARINVLAIAQGAAETNISAIVAETDLERAIRALHVAFARSTERVHLVLIGTGTVGRVLLDLLESQAPALARDRDVEMRLVGVCRSRTMVWDNTGIQPSEALMRLSDEGTDYDLASLQQQILDSHLERLIVIDATASAEVADTYTTFLTAGIGVVTPNKRANTGALATWHALQEAAHRKNVPYLYETTVGAGLPVISTLRDLVRSGDRVHRIDGILSGTLAFVCNRLAAGASFSEAVREAKAQGFTEPDPREDLSGEDVARKLLTLARQAGFEVSREDMDVESLVPEAFKDLDAAEFVERLPEQDAAWAERLGGRTWQYVASLEVETVAGLESNVSGPPARPRLRVALQPVGEESPFRSLKGTDNMVVYTTDRYNERPMVIQGAGAGPLVTAAGVLVDLIHAARTMR